MNTLAARIIIPDDVQKIMTELTVSGFTAYVVGGCVRDSLLGREPKDWDIATNATPKQMRAVFDCGNDEFSLIPTGEEYGTMTVKYGETLCEVTTFRMDGEYSDGRRPDVVTFGFHIEDDLARRDFTINAMAYNDARRIIDLYGGVGDLLNGVIRCVGDAEQRFNEDALRVMRAVRFAVNLDFSIDKATQLAIWECGHNLENIAHERKTAELIKILSGLRKMNTESGHCWQVMGMVCYIIKRIIPEFQELAQLTHNNPYHYADIFTHTTETVVEAARAGCGEGEDGIILLLALLFHDIGKLKARVFDEKRLTNHYYGHEAISAEMTRDILTRMRFGADMIEKVVKLVNVHDFLLTPRKTTVKKLLNRLNDITLVRVLRQLQGFDKAAHAWASQDGFDKWRNDADEFMLLAEEVVKQNEAWSISGLAIGGGDVMEALGIPQGKQVGIALNKCLELVIEEPEKNNSEVLLAYIKENAEGWFNEENDTAKR